MHRSGTSLSETEKLQESVNAINKTFQDLSLFLSQQEKENSRHEHQMEEDSVLNHSLDTQFDVHQDDPAANQSEFFDESQQRDTTLLAQEQNSTFLGGMQQNSATDMHVDDLNNTSSSNKLESRFLSPTRRKHRLQTSTQPSSQERSQNQRKSDIREISNLLLDLQDEPHLDSEVNKESILKVEKQAEQLVHLVKEASSKKVLDMDKEQQFLRELNTRLGGSSKSQNESQTKLPNRELESWEEVSMLRTQWTQKDKKDTTAASVPSRSVRQKSNREYLLESQNTLKSPSRFEALHTRLLEQPQFVEEFTEATVKKSRKALLVSVYNPKLPARDESLKTMYNICRILNFDEIMVLDTRNGTRKGVILHYYNELLKDASSEDVRLFYMYGEAQLIYKDPQTYSFRDSTRRREVGISRWDLESTLHTSCIRIWDAVVDKDFDEYSCDYTPPVSHVSVELTAATPRTDVQYHETSPFSKALFEIVRWYAERRRVCTNRSLKFQLRLMQDEGEFGDGGVEFECFRQELDEEFTSTLSEKRRMDRKQQSRSAENDQSR